MTKKKNEHEGTNLVSGELETCMQGGAETMIAERDDEEALQRAIEEAIQNPQTEVSLNSLEAATEFGSLLRELQHSYLKRVAYYRSKAGGSYSLEESREAAYHACTNEEEAKQQLDQLRSYPLDLISFADILPLMTIAPRMAEDFWGEMKVEALMEFESGHLASKALMPVGYMRTAWNTACYLGLRASLKDEWQPRGGIELSLIDMLAQAFLQYQYWVKQSVLRTQTEPRQEAPEYTQWKSRKREEMKAGGWGHGWWDIPYVREKEAIEHAAQMADRWNRIYMRTLRNLRDLRRYSTPVTINNPQQVNIAADGGQQVNVAKE